MKTVSEKLLSPKYLTDSDFSYESVKELMAAVAQVECRNIAVTGINGAGKSSVINTFVDEYEKTNPDKRLLRISLSTFDLGKVDKSGESYENDIEYKLVQQILYRSNPDELYQSSFRRIHYRSSDNIKWLTIHILVTLAAAIILFEPSFLRIDSLYDLYFCILGTTVGECVNKIFDFASLGWLVYVAYLMISWSIKRLCAISSLRLKAKDYEMELSKDSSVFSKMLEELYYFFRAGKYDVVIIEDLDRLKDPSNLFLKLRELNIMLNESYSFRSENRTLKFVYAVRDDLFDSDIRVKFFDYIVPVVPIIDSHNAADYIIEKRTDIYEGNDEFKQAIPEIALFIKEKRVLQNVLNEYEVYYNTIFSKQPHLVESKLLAMIVYKNLWPDNYSLLHRRSSILNILFDNSIRMVTGLFKKDVEKLDELVEEITSIKEKLLLLRKEYVDYIESEYNVVEFKNGSLSYSLNDLVENDYYFLKLQRDEFEKYVYLDRANRETSTIIRDFSFEEIEEAIDQDGAKVLTLSRLRNELDEKEMNKARLERDLAHKKASSYKEFLTNVDGDQALSCIKELVGRGVSDELSEFILSMLRKGYIAEDYHKYISFYYEGSLSARDSAFVNAVLQGRSLGFDYLLDNPKEVRKQLKKEDNYNENSILNYRYIDFLVSTKDSFLRNVAIVARNNWDFIKGYDLLGDNNSTFLREYVFSWWYDCLNSIFKSDSDSISENLQVFFHYCPDIDPDAKMKDALSSMYDVVANGTTAASAELVAKWVVDKGLVFKSIRPPMSGIEKDLYETVMREGLFVISKQNMSVVFGEQYEEASYTTISKCGNISLIRYLKSHISETIQTFPETSINEEEGPLKELMNNNDINADWKKAYLGKQTCIMNDLVELSDEGIELVLQSSKVVANWGNVYYAVGRNAENALKGFIAANIRELVSQKCVLEEDKSITVEKLLFSDNDYLTLENFVALISQFDVKIDADDLSELDNDRMLLMLQQNLVAFSESGLALLSSYNTPVIAQYIINYFEEYKELFENYNDFCNNEFGLYILESSLSDEQKTYYLDNISPTSLKKDEYYHSYSKQICIFLNRTGLSDESDVEMVVNALEGYDDGDGWHDKIALINKVNTKFEYDEQTETRMINSLGGGYPQLNTYYGAIVLDNNFQNQELLDYLVENGHFVNRYYHQEDGRLKVTFKRDPNR